MKNAKTECLNYDHTYCNCRVLDKDSCYKCSFYTDRAESVKRRKRARERLQNLPLDQQAYIADKYYNGVAVWNIEVGKRLVI